jgi:hypothetical protein
LWNDFPLATLVDSVTVSPGNCFAKLTPAKHGSRPDPRILFFQGSDPEAMDFSSIIPSRQTRRRERGGDVIGMVTGVGHL